METRPLRKKTLFITGASRGIGKAIAMRAAADGANIAVAAKTTEPHPKLPGTIHTAHGGRATMTISFLDRHWHVGQQKINYYRKDLEIRDQVQAENLFILIFHQS